mmetsp:Transcript_2200/g.5105  ORF Transcript_2200/g.5105 Transcript_2200/m.5105 type:complete len:286 (-) Transcript_2200:647-1504(-)
MWLQHQHLLLPHSRSLHLPQDHQPQPLKSPKEPLLNLPPYPLLPLPSSRQHRRGSSEVAPGLATQVHFRPFSGARSLPTAFLPAQVFRPPLGGLTTALSLVVRNSPRGVRAASTSFREVATISCPEGVVAGSFLVAAVLCLGEETAVSLCLAARTFHQEAATLDSLCRVDESHPRAAHEAHVSTNLTLRLSLWRPLSSILQRCSLRNVTSHRIVPSRTQPPSRPSRPHKLLSSPSDPPPSPIRMQAKTATRMKTGTWTRTVTTPACCWSSMAMEAASLPTLRETI